jgi:hypothetical protein
MDSRLDTRPGLDQEQDRTLEAIKCDSREQVDAMAGNLRRFLAAENVSMMGGWT